MGARNLIDRYGSAMPSPLTGMPSGKTERRGTMDTTEDTTERPGTTGRQVMLIPGRRSRDRRSVCRPSHSVLR
jgi:hypothetical protein